MAIAGPRLDRPSIVGTEGRPRSTSLTVAALAVVGVVLATLWALGARALALPVGLAVALTVVGLALVSRDRFGALVVGHLCFHPGAALLVILLAGSLSIAGGLVVAGSTLALLGIAGTWANVLERDRLSTAVREVPISYVATLLWMVAIAFAILLGLGTASFVDGRVGVGSAPDALFGFLLSVAIAGALVRTSIWTLPLVELTPVSARPRRRRQLAAAGRATTVVVAGAVGALVLAGVGGGRTAISEAVVADPTLGTALVALSSPLVLGPVLFVASLGLVATATGVAAHEVASRVDRGNYGALAGVLAGFVLGMLLVVYLYLPLSLLFYPGLVGIGILAPLGVLIAGYVAVAAMDAGLVPNRAAGPALSAAGLLAVAVGAALAGLPGPLVFAAVAAAVLVWDLSTFGLGVTVELGHRPETRRLELYHGVLSTGVGVVAVVAATGLDWLRRTVGGEVGAWPAVASAVLGAVLLAVARYRWKDL